MSLEQLLLILAVIFAAFAALTRPSGWCAPMRLNIVAAAVGLIAAALLVAPGFHFT